MNEGRALGWQCWQKPKSRHGIARVREDHDYYPPHEPMLERREVNDIITIRLRGMYERRSEKPSGAVQKKASGAASSVVQNRLAEVEKQLSELTERMAVVEGCVVLEDGGTITDPYLDWCAANKAKLLKYPDSYVAIDIDAGEVRIADADESRFIEQLAKIPPKVRVKLYRMHTAALG